MTIKKTKAVWTKNPPVRDLASAQDFTGVTPVAGTGTDINQNSKIYSKYIETPVDIGSNAVKRPDWKPTLFGDKQKQDNSQVDNTT
jgi:hypothetical protein